MTRRIVSLVTAFALVLCCCLACGGISVARAAGGFDVTMEPVNSWQSGSQYFTQYTFTLANNSDKAVTSWKIHLPLTGSGQISQYWNAEIAQTGTAAELTPVSYNGNIAAGASVTDIGVIIALNSEAKLTEFTAECEYADGSTGANDPDAVVEVTSITYAASGTAAPAPTPAPTVEVDSTVSTMPKGALHVDGTHLVDSTGSRVQLRGVSTHGLAWFPEYVNYDAFKTLRDDWGVNVLRLAMYTAEYGGYCNGGDQSNLKKLIDNGVQYASRLGMYVIIDWHILSDGNPTTHQSEAVSFFTEMSAKYKDYDNVIYEICNEPQNSSWKNVIKPYAEKVIAAIRKNDSDAIVIVGTNTWSQDVTDVAGNMIKDDNVVYALHFYAGTHKDDLRNKLTSALKSGVPVFVSECSICDASGNGGIDYNSAQAWLTLLNKNGVSFIAWSLSNKAETASLIKSSCKKTSGWSDADLSDTGKWFKKAISGK